MEEVLNSFEDIANKRYNKKLVQDSTVQYSTVQYSNIANKRYNKKLVQDGTIVINYEDPGYFVLNQQEDRVKGQDREIINSVFINNIPRSLSTKNRASQTGLIIPGNDDLRGNILVSVTDPSTDNVLSVKNARTRTKFKNAEEEGENQKAQSENTMFTGEPEASLPVQNPKSSF